MTENDKVSSWEKMTKNDWKWHSKDQIYVLKLMWYLNINYSTSKMLKNAKKKQSGTDRPTDRPTDGPTDRPTDTVTYRVACTRLKSAEPSYPTISINHLLITRRGRPKVLVTRSLMRSNPCPHLARAMLARSQTSSNGWNLHCFNHFRHVLAWADNDNSVK